MDQPDRYVAIRAALAEAGLGLDPRPSANGGIDHIVTGDTFAHRDLIKQLGGRWSTSRRVWIIGDRPPGSTPGLSEHAGALDLAAWGTRHYHGHRERLRQRFVAAGAETLPDYELLELLLFFSVYRRDTKPLAKALIERFGSLGGVLAADPQRYAECVGLQPLPADADPERQSTRDDDLRFTQVLLKAVHELVLRVLKEPLQKGTPISSWAALIDYLQASLAHDPTEQFRVLFLDRKNQLIRDERQSRGTVDHTPLYPREVVKRALELSASAIIMVHNHPSGDPTPSEADVEMTRQVVDALETVGVSLHDHVIVGKNRHLSFRAQKLI